MRRANVCIICANANLQRNPAWVSPFIVSYVLGLTELSCEALMCPECGIIFSSTRFDETEMAKLYSRYRGEEYVRERERFEHGYRLIHDRIADSSDEIAQRRAFAASLIRKSKIACFGRALDYGGDRGQFIPLDLSIAEPYVHEVSERVPDPGIIRLERADVKAPYDLIMCCHVMEHLPDPLRIANEIRTLLTPEGLLYIEVPADLSPGAYVKAVSGASWKSYAPKEFHEHINIFTTRSLKNLLMRAGFRAIAMRLWVLNLGWARPAVIGCIARPADSAQTKKQSAADLAGDALALLVGKMRARLMWRVSAGL